MALFSPCPHMAVPLCVSVLLSSYKDLSHTGSGFTLVTSVSLWPRTCRSHRSSLKPIPADWGFFTFHGFCPLRRDEVVEGVLRAQGQC